MNKVEKVSIGKCAFSLDETAYTKVKKYLDSLNSYYSKMEGGREIMEGIEERMAELLMEKTPGISRPSPAPRSSRRSATSSR